VKVVEKTAATANSTRKFVWHGQERLELRDGTDAVTQRNFTQGQYVGTTAYFYTRDHLGSIREMFTGGGTVVARYDYDPYGRSTTVLGTTPTDFNFTGLYRHSESNLDFATFRAYDSDLGRWLSRDPIAERGGLNLYEYSANNSVNLIDPIGHNPVAIGAGIGTFFGPEGTIIGAGIGAIVGIVGGVAIYDYIHNKAETAPCETKKCPPCVPPVGTIGYRLDRMPPSTPHHPFPGDHVHLFERHQNPNNCQCFWHPIGVTSPPPPPGAFPLP
jgi:RHS repeat-associated protein